MMAQEWFCIMEHIVRMLAIIETLHYCTYRLSQLLSSAIQSTPRRVTKYVFRRTVIVKEEDKPVDVIPQEFAARTLAQEYGGGAFAVDKSAIVFSNYKDQRLYKLAIGSKY